MKIKTTEAEGDTLDYLVWCAERGEQPRCSVAEWTAGNDDGYHPSGNWAHGGPIIDARRINITSDGAGIRAAVYERHARVLWHGAPDVLTAAMRAYVAKVFGDEVELL